MEIEEILEMETESTLAAGELRNLTVNNNGEFSVIWMHNYDYIIGLSGREKDEESARALANVMATNAVKLNYYEDDGKTIILGTEYSVYNSKGEYICTGQITKNLIH